MTKVTFTISLSIDGYAAGPSQSLDNPLGEGGMNLHTWVFPTRYFHEMTGQDGGETGLDHEQVTRWHRNLGATIMGRNMFGPSRGAWPDDEWRGWWGDDPPYHTPVFVLTHHPRDPIPMQGGTTFHFVTDGIEAALERAVAAAGGKDVAIAGGAQTGRAYLRAGLIDEFGLHVAPVMLGGGERLLDNLGEAPAGYDCVEISSSPLAAHFTYARAAG